MPASPETHWSDFAGPIRRLVFPGVLVFPYSTQPLRVTDAGQVRLVRDALANMGGLLGLGVLAPGWETQPATQHAPVQEIGCLARVAVSQDLGDAGLLVLVQGLTRLRFEADDPLAISPQVAGLERELVVGRALADRYPSPAAIDRQRRRQELLELYGACFASDRSEVLESLARHELSLGCLCDVLAQGITLPTTVALELLATTNIDYRSDVLLDQLRIAQRRQCEYPPQFSAN